MDKYRLKHSFMLCLKRSGRKRALYCMRKNIFYNQGQNCMFMFRKIPLYPKLISFGENVHVATGVSFITHDVTHNMLNARKKDNGKLDGQYQEYLGCITVGNNVFIGSNSIILYNSNIPSDSIIGAGSLVNRKLRESGVYAGVPARYICSLEEYLNKRERYDVEVKRYNESLSSVTIKELWERNIKEQNDKY